MLHLNIINLFSVNTVTIFNIFKLVFQLIEKTMFKFIKIIKY